MLACATMSLDAPVAQAARIVHPRMGAALGIEPAHGAQLEVASGTNFPVVYHGGSVMHGAGSYAMRSATRARSSVFIEQ